MMRLSIIVALDLDGGIGFQGALPWRLPDDQKMFRQLTMGHTVLMGRKTYESIGRVLAGRKMMVLTHQKDFNAPGCILTASLEAGLAAAEAAGETELFVIGGGELYARALPLVQRLYLTHVDARLAADTFFPSVDLAQWRVLERTEHAADERHSYPFTFEILERTA